MFFTDKLNFYKVLAFIAMLLLPAGAMAWDDREYGTNVSNEKNEQNTPSGWTAVQLPNITSHGEFNITQYGASTGSSDNAAAINAAISAANAAGGGIVIIPSGTWMVGNPLDIKSNVVLHLSKNCTLKMQPKGKYPAGKENYLISNRTESSTSNVIIEGEGETSVIDGNGADWWPYYKSAAAEDIRPGSIIRIKKGSNHLFRNFKITMAPQTNLTIGMSGNVNNVTVHDVIIKNPAAESDLLESGYTSVSHNTDGIPVWGHHVNIYNCDINTGDDNIVCDDGAYNIHAWNIKCGCGHGMSVGSNTKNVHDIVYENITFKNTTSGFRIKSDPSKSGNDQVSGSTGAVKNIVCRNATMTGVRNPIKVTSWYDADVEDASTVSTPSTITATTPEFCHITFQNITADAVSYSYNSWKHGAPVYLYGRPELKIHHITFDNINISSKSNRMYLAYCENVTFKNKCVVKTGSSVTSPYTYQASYSGKYDGTANSTYDDAGTSPVYFNNGENTVYTTTVLNGQQVNKPADPVDGDKVFKGWTTPMGGTSIVTFPQTINGATTFYAVWETASSGGGSESSDATEVSYDFENESVNSDWVTYTDKIVNAATTCPMAIGNGQYKVISDTNLSGYTKSLSANTNPSISGGAPTAGTYYKFTPTVDGTLKVAMILNATKSLYINEGTTSILGSVKITNASGDEVTLGTNKDSKGNEIDNSVAVKLYGYATFAVTAGKTYYVYCGGSKLGLYGYVFTPTDTPSTPETPEPPSVGSDKTFTFVPTDGVTVDGGSSANPRYTRTSVDNPGFSLSGNSKISSDSRFKMVEGASAVYSLNVPSNAVVTKIEFTNCSENYYDNPNSGDNHTTTFTVASNGATVVTTGADGNTLQYLAKGQLITSTISNHVMGTPITFVADGGKQLAFGSIVVYYNLSNTGNLSLIGKSVEDNATMSRNGRIAFTFDNDVTLADGAEIKINGTSISTEVSGPNVVGYYSGMNYGESCTATLAANSVSDEFGNKYASEISVRFSIDTRPTVSKQAFDKIVGNGDELAAAIAEANSRQDQTSRYRIFVKKGAHILPTNGKTTGGDGKEYPDPRTHLTGANVSIIGEDFETTSFTNITPEAKWDNGFGKACPLEGIGSGDVLIIDKTATETYFQGVTIRTSMGDAHGRDIAVNDQSNKTIMKDVRLWGYQDTYVSNNSNGRFYFDGGVLRGRTDYLCGKGDVYYNKVTLQQVGTGGYIAVPSVPLKYGYVFNECYIKNETSDVNYYLGRPWGQGTPIAMFINTKVDAAPLSDGWAEMSGGWPDRFAEYNTKTTTGAVVTVSNRKTTFASSHTNNPVLTSAEASYYSNMARVMGGTDGWDPTLHTEQCGKPSAQLNGETLTWSDDSYASSWIVFKDGEYYANPTTNILALTESGSYTVRAANNMGGLGEVSGAVAYTKTVLTAPEKTVWDFAEYTEQVVAAGANYKTQYNGLTIVGNTNETYTSDYIKANDGFHCNGSSASAIRHIVFTPSANGVLFVTYKSNNATANDRITAIGTEVITGTDVSKLLANNKVLAAGLTSGSTLQTISAELTAGTTYYVYFANGGQSITKLEYIEPMVLSEDKDYSEFPEFEKGVVTLKRTFDQNKWTTLVVPFDVSEAQLKETFGEDVEVANIDKMQGGSLYYKGATTISANEPVLIKVAQPHGDNTYAFNLVTVKNSSNPVAESADGTQLVGVYKTMSHSALPQTLYFLYDGKFYDASYLNTLRSFRAYILPAEGFTASSKGITMIPVSDTATGINAQEQRSEDGVIYNVAGQRVAKPAKGLYIINGKKYIAR